MRYQTVEFKTKSEAEKRMKLMKLQGLTDLKIIKSLNGFYVISFNKQL